MKNKEWTIGRNNIKTSKKEFAENIEELIGSGGVDAVLHRYGIVLGQFHMLCSLHKKVRKAYKRGIAQIELDSTDVEEYVMWLKVFENGGKELWQKIVENGWK